MAENVKEEHYKDIIKEWLATQQHLPQISDKKIRIFLHSCQYKVEYAKKTIEAHYRIKASTPEFFANRDPSGTDIQEIQRVVELVLLPKPSPDGHRIILGRLKSASLTHFSWNSAIKLLFMVCDMCEVIEELIPGFFFVFDAKHFTLQHMTKMNFVTIKKYLAYTQEAMPICRKGIFILNVNSVVTQLLALLKPFLRAEHLKMIMLFDGIPEKFYTSVPKECLPSDYNGTQDTTSQLADATKELMIKYSEWYKEEEMLKFNGPKCDKQKVLQDAVYGTEGSFKTLSID